MSPFAKLISSILGVAAIFYFFTAISFLSINPKTETIDQKVLIDQKALIEYITKEVNYEIIYGEENFDLEAFVDQAMINALKKN